MRRVWYSYALSLCTGRAFWHGVVLGGSSVLLLKSVSVTILLQSFLQVPVGNVPQYLLQVIEGSLASGDLVPTIALGVVVFSLLTFRFSLRPHESMFSEQVRV